MHTYPFVLLLLLFTACGGDGTPAPAESEARDTLIQPAVGTVPTPLVSGAIDYKIMELADFRDVEGCTILLWPENRESGQYVYGFNYAEGPAEGTFGGSFQTLEAVGGEDGPADDGPFTFVHANDEYEITTTVTQEQQVDSELWEISGTVVVRNRQTGETLRVQVLGEQGC